MTKPDQGLETLKFPTQFLPKALKAGIPLLRYKKVLMQLLPLNSPKAASDRFVGSRTRLLKPLVKDRVDVLQESVPQNVERLVHVVTTGLDCTSDPPWTSTGESEILLLDHELLAAHVDRDVRKLFQFGTCRIDPEATLCFRIPNFGSWYLAIYCLGRITTDQRQGRPRVCDGRISRSGEALAIDDDGLGFETPESNDQFVVYH